MEDINKLRDLLILYCNEQDLNKKNEIIEQAKKEYKNQDRIIDRIIAILSKLESSDSRISFINNVFSNDQYYINAELMDNIESQLDNRTTINATISEKAATIITYDKFIKEEKSISYIPLTEKVVHIDNSKKNVTQIDESDTRIYNNMIERLLGFTNKKLEILKIDSKEYLLSDFVLPNINKQNLIKEESLCDPREIQYLFDRIIGERTEKKYYLERILIDLITNQNYRDFNEDLECINSDLNENDYYVLNGLTIKKDYAFESLYRNYKDEISGMTNLIVDNYELILKLIEDLIKVSNEVNTKYLENLKINVVRVYEKSKIEKGLDAIEFGTDVDIFDEKRRKANEDFEQNLLLIKEAIKTKKLIMSNNGYSNIIILLVGVVIFGIFLAYLMLQL